MTPNPHRFINPAELAQPRGYTHVVETSGKRTVYISGQVAFDAAGHIIGVGDMRAQAEQVFKNLNTALASVGASFADVVKLTYYVVDMSQMQVIRDVRDTFITTQQYPASTAVGVTSLAREGLLLEIEAIAVLAD